jgi:peptidoglycan hydrolase-like protein with peptidoglycan-binding domain
MKRHVFLLLAALATAACQTPLQSAAPETSVRQEVSVRDVQSALKRLGYYRGGVDGIAGPRTRTAVRQGQADFGLTVTGEAYGVLLDRAERHLRENPPHRDLPTAAQVFALQRGPSRLGYYDGPNDGRYLGDTLKALLLYKREKGLPISHKLDARTLRRIEREAAAAPVSS